MRLHSQTTVTDIQLLGKECEKSDRKTKLTLFDRQYILKKNCPKRKKQTIFRAKQMKKLLILRINKKNSKITI